MTREEAIKIVKTCFDKWALDDKGLEAMKVLIPELAESEDERIRKAIIEHFRNHAKNGEKTFANLQVSEFIAWLEKQKINTEGDFGRGYDCGYEACLNSHGAEWFEKQKEHDKVDILNKAFEESKTDYSLEEKTKAVEYSDSIIPTSISMGENDDEYKLHKIIEAAFIAGQKEHKPKIELIQRSWYMKGYHDGKYKREPKWILKTGEGGPRHKLNPRYGEPLAEQKSAEWGEEDENYYDTIVRKLQIIGDDSGLTMNQIDFLEKHRPQHHWKPSEEQMKAILNAINYVPLGGDTGGYLKLLYNDLKKLM